MAYLTRAPSKTCLEFGNKHLNCFLYEILRDNEVDVFCETFVPRIDRVYKLIKAPIILSYFGMVKIHISVPTLDKKNSFAKFEPSLNKLSLF